MPAAARYLFAITCLTIVALLASVLIVNTSRDRAARRWILDGPAHVPVRRTHRADNHGRHGSCRGRQHPIQKRHPVEHEHGLVHASEPSGPAPSQHDRIELHSCSLASVLRHQRLTGLSHPLTSREVQVVGLCGTMGR